MKANETSHGGPHLRSRLVVLTAALALLTSPALWGAGEGRMIGTVVDDAGNPIAGVQVTITSLAVDNFLVETKTKKNGTFSAAFADAYQVYLYKFEKDGYQTLQVEHKASQAGINRETFTLHAGEPDESSAASTTVQSSSNDAVIAFNAGLEAFNSGNLQEAVTQLEAALAADPEIYQAHLLLAEIYMKQKNYQQAVKRTEAALALVPGNSDGLRMRYQAYRELGDKAKADEAFAEYKAAGEAAEEAKRVYNEGVALDKAGDTAAAYEKFLQASDLNPNMKLAQTGVMAAAFKTERYREAATAAERLLVTDPTNPQALRVRYDSYVNLEDEPKRREALLGLAAVDPEFVLGTLMTEAAAVFNAGDMQGSKPLFAKILELDPERAKVHYFLGLIAVNEGNNPKAREHLARFVELDPNDPDAATAREMINYLK